MNTKKILALVCVGFGLAGIGSKAANACDLYCACDVKWTKSGTVEKNKAGRRGSDDNGKRCDEFLGGDAGDGAGKIVACREVNLSEFKKLFPDFSEDDEGNSCDG